MESKLKKEVRKAIVALSENIAMLVTFLGVALIAVCLGWFAHLLEATNGLGGISPLGIFMLKATEHVLLALDCAVIIKRAWVHLMQH